MFVCYMVFKSGHTESVSSPDREDVDAIGQALDAYYNLIFNGNVNEHPIFDFAGGLIKINLSELAMVAINEIALEGDDEDDGK